LINVEEEELKMVLSHAIGERERRRNSREEAIWAKTQGSDLGDTNGVDKIGPFMGP